MFFNISSQKLDNFPVQIDYNNFVINLDQGWSVVKKDNGKILIFKGYVDDGLLSYLIDDIVQQSVPSYYGNFCIFECDNNQVRVITDVLRSFPIWYNQTGSLTNLVPGQYTIWTDSVVTLNSNFELIEKKFNLEFLDSTDKMSFDQVVKKVDDILAEKIFNFFQRNTLPVKVFLSGGIDTMLIYSYIKKLNIDHELLGCNHIDFDYFYLKNHDTLSKFWGYKQIHHWKEPCVLVSGAPGDEFTVRSPATANLILRYYKSSIPDLLKTYTNSLHYIYFSNEKNNDIWNAQKNLVFNSLHETINYCLNINYNDWQHWHLGNTLTYTPLRDQKIFSCIAMLDEQELKNQIMDSTVQLELIRRNDKSLLNALSKQKNSFNNMENLTNLLT